MKITTKKLSAGKYAVLVDGRETRLVIERGDAPRYGHRQEWSIGVVRENGFMDPLADDQNGLHGAVNTIAQILAACAVLETV